jgi:transcriptional regulator with XRE-family HTH domain
MQESLGHKLRLMRAERGLSLREAARRAGVVKETISDIERGHTHPYDVTLAKLAKVYDVPLEEFLEEPALAGKAEAPPLSEPLVNEDRLPASELASDTPEEEEHLRYLRGWRAFIHGLARRWEEEPPQTSKEIDPTLGALVPLLEQGVFDPSGSEGLSEAQGLALILDGLGRLAEIAQKVEQEAGQGSEVSDLFESAYRKAG